MTNHVDRITFSFGENWLAYVREDLSEDRIQMAVDSIKTFTGAADLQGRSFLDLGCGSGLFSLAAHRLGATKITSVDRDRASLEATCQLRRVVGAPPHWSVLQGDILDSAFVAKLSAADFVYCWGVVHHTGAMYRAIENVCQLVKADGLLELAVYNRQRLSPAWHAIKRFYNRAPSVVQKSMVGSYGCVSLASKVLRGENPLGFLRQYSVSSRGMSFKRDLADWLGGLPYEYATPEEIQAFVKPLGFQLLNVKVVNNHGCNRFLFMRTRSSREAEKRPPGSSEL